MENQHIITVAALGPDSGDMLTMGALRAMKTRTRWCSERRATARQRSLTRRA